MPDVDLHSTTDARVWAQEFKRRLHPGPAWPSEDLMLGWFANAIEAGRDAGARGLDLAYRERNEVVAVLAALFPSWVGVDPAEPDWPVIYVELPTGQVSWHVSFTDLRDLFARIPSRDRPWDGHTREVRTSRLAAFAVVFADLFRHRQSQGGTP
jgi:hypothetical protein